MIGDVITLRPGDGAAATGRRRDWSPIAHPAAHEFLAHTPNPKGYSFSEAGAVMVPRSDRFGGSLGFKPNRPGIVNIDPKNIVEGTGGITVDMGKVTEDDSRMAADEGYGDPVTSWEKLASIQRSKGIDAEHAIKQVAPIGDQASVPQASRQPQGFVIQQPPQPQPIAMPTQFPTWNLPAAPTQQPAPMPVQAPVAQPAAMPMPVPQPMPQPMQQPVQQVAPQPVPQPVIPPELVAYLQQMGQTVAYLVQAQQAQAQQQAQQQLSRPAPAYSVPQPRVPSPRDEYEEEEDEDEEQQRPAEYDPAPAQQTQDAPWEAPPPPTKKRQPAAKQAAAKQPATPAKKKVVSIVGVLAGPPTRPTVPVIFHTSAGLHQQYFHHVAIRGASIMLFYDSRYEGDHRFLPAPTERDKPIHITLPADDDARYRCHILPTSNKLDYIDIIQLLVMPEDDESQAVAERNAEQKGWTATPEQLESVRSSLDDE